MKFVLIQVLATLATLAATGPVPDASAEEPWYTLVRTLTPNDKAVIDVTPEGELVSLVDGRVIDSIQLSEAQTEEALAALASPRGKQREPRSAVPGSAESLGLEERQIIRCQSIRCYTALDCDYGEDVCYFCAANGYCY